MPEFVEDVGAAEGCGAGVGRLSCIMIASHGPGRDNLHRNASITKCGRCRWLVKAEDYSVCGHDGTSHANRHRMESEFPNHLTFFNLNFPYKYYNRAFAGRIVSVKDIFISMFT